MSTLTIAIFLFAGLLKAEALACSVGPLGDASSIVNTFSFDGAQAVEYNSSRRSLRASADRLWLAGFSGGWHAGAPDFLEGENDEVVDRIRD